MAKSSKKLFKLLVESTNTNDEKELKRILRQIERIEYNQELYQIRKKDRLKTAKRINNNNTNETETLAAKALCKELSDYTCKRCGSKENIHAHHILECGRPTSTNNQDNLVCLCNSCHQKLHAQYRKHKEFNDEEIINLTEEFINKI